MSVVVREVTASYGTTTVLAGISLEVETGGWLAPIGPNGAGKTTLLRAIAGLQAVHGAIELNSRDLSGLSKRELGRLVAYVPQRPAMPGAMTVAEYVFLGRTPHLALLGSERALDRRIVGEVLERLALGPLAGRELAAISGGEAQRAALGRALAQEASILLLDEPTASLDVGHQQQVLELVDELRLERRLTVISAMHDLTLAGQFASELVLIDAGRVLVSGTPHEVLSEAVLARCYGTAVRVLCGPNGEPIVLAARGRARLD